jgi:D-lyxose ketol-isomerase
VTDFGSGISASAGSSCSPCANGNLKLDKKPYAEKIMIVDVDQETPMHFHFHKMEDIINRGGGNLAIEVYASTEDEKLSDRPLEISVDGMRRTVAAGTKIVLKPGESVCLEPFMYHRFWAEGSRCLRAR